MKVLILSCNTGGGHNSASQALKEELQRRGIECQVTDALSFGPRYFSELISKLHTIAYRYFPKVYGAGYRSKEQLIPADQETFESRMNAICVPRLYRYLHNNHFDTIITPHVFPAEMLTRIRRKYCVTWKSYFIATDYTCSPCVNEIRPDYWIIPDERLRPEFVQKGIPENRIVALGIPTAKRFEQTVEKCAARQQLHLPQEGRLILLMSGSIGCGPMESLSSRILRHIPRRDHVVAVCGNNKRLYKEMLRLARFRKNLIPVQFTDRVDLYLSAADVVVTKPGGLSSTEIAHKGTPAVFLLAVPGCESRNMEFFSRYGMAIATETAREALRAVLRLLGSPSLQREMQAAQKSIPGGTAVAICDLICEHAGRTPVPIPDKAN